MAVSDFAKLDTHGTIKLIDGTPITPVELTLSYDMGDLSLSGFSKVLNELVKVERRGKFVSAGYGNRKYPQLTFTNLLMALTSAAAPGTAREFLEQQGAYSANISTLGAGKPYTVHVEVTIEGSDFGDSADHVFQADDCHLSDVGLSEGQPSTLSFSLEVLGAISGDIAAAEIA